MNRFRHRGIDRAGRDAVDADAERGQFDRELLGEMRKSGLAGAVGRAQRRRAHREIEVMLTIAPPPCSRIRGTAALVQRNGPVRLTSITRFHRLRSLHQRREHRDPGVVDQRIEPAEAALDRGEGARNRIGVGDVAGHSHRDVAARQRRHAFRQKVALDIEQRHAPVVSEEALGHGKSDAARRACDERDFSATKRSCIFPSDFSPARL